MNDSPSAGEYDIEVKMEDIGVEVVMLSGGGSVVGDQKCDIVVIRHSLVIGILVVDSVGLGVHQDKLWILLQSAHKNICLSYLLAKAVNYII